MSINPWEDRSQGAIIEIINRESLSNTGEVDEEILEGELANFAGDLMKVLRGQSDSPVLTTGWEEGVESNIVVDQKRKMFFRHAGFGWSGDVETRAWGGKTDGQTYRVDVKDQVVRVITMKDDGVAESPKPLAWSASLAWVSRIPGAEVTMEDIIKKFGLPAELNLDEIAMTSPEE
ncbi:MAG: hypothetical protein ACD_40C00271G0016 [uncultured bacterium]|nr:MAG: hypothetical protein ACD_40C00271G0016 [uncultured bacterium]